MHVCEIKGSSELREAAEAGQRPLLLLDIDGVISLFGFPSQHPPAGRFHAIEGVPHFLSAAAAGQLRRLAGSFELAWASGWEDRANDHLPHLLALPGPLPFLRFARSAGAGSSMRAHWKLDAVEAYVGERAMAWVDDAFDVSCERWAAQRDAPTLLLATEPAVGLTDAQADQLLAWASSVS
jgi:hypothetical protein